MGRTMKTLLIVAVAAVAAWLLMKRRNGSATPVAIDATPATDTSTAEGVINAINATSAEKYAMRQIVKLIKKSETWYKAEQDNALGQGHTMAQQLALAAAWQLYANDYPSLGVKLTYERYNQLHAEIEGLG